MSKSSISLLALGALSLLFTIHLISESLQPDTRYDRDFDAPYLMVRALAEGENPYTPIPELNARYLPEAPPIYFQHPTPHPPPLAIVCLPLAFLNYRTAVWVWFGVQITQLVLSALLIQRVIAPKSSKELACAVAFLGLLTAPLLSEIRIGQVNLLLLPVLCLAWIDLRANREGRGGAWLGLLFALKLFAWPVVIYFAIRRQWRVALSACVVALTANLFMAALIGLRVVMDYYLKVGPQVSAIYRLRGLNFSAFGFGRRLFEGVRLGTSSGIEIPALWPSSTLAGFAGIAAPAIVLIIGLRLACRSMDFDVAFGILVCVSLLVNPTAWHCYLVHATIPMVVMAMRLRGLRFPIWPTVSYCAIAVTLYWLLFAYESIARWIGGREAGPLSSGLAVGLTALPALALFALAALLWRMGREEIHANRLDLGGIQRGYVGANSV